MPKPSVFLPLLLCLNISALAQSPAQQVIDHDLYEADIAHIQNLYATHKYTVTQVVQWHLARIHKYNGIYRAVETVLEKQASLAQPKKTPNQPAASTAPLGHSHRHQGQHQHRRRNHHRRLGPLHPPGP